MNPYKKERINCFKAVCNHILTSCEIVWRGRGARGAQHFGEFGKTPHKHRQVELQNVKSHKAATMSCHQTIWVGQMLRNVIVECFLIIQNIYFLK